MATHPDPVISESLVSISHVSGSVLPSYHHFALRLVPSTLKRTQKYVSMAMESAWVAILSYDPLSYLLILRSPLLTSVKYAYSFSIPEPLIYPRPS